MPCKLSEHEFRLQEESGSSLACLMTSLTFSCSSPSYRHLFQLLPQPSLFNSNPVPLTSANNSLYISPHPHPLMPLYSPPSEGSVTCLDEKLDNIWSFLLTTHWPCPQFPHHFFCWPYWLCFKLSPFSTDEVLKLIHSLATFPDCYHQHLSDGRPITICLLVRWSATVGTLHNNGTLQALRKLIGINNMLIIL